MARRGVRLGAWLLGVLAMTVVTEGLAARPLGAEGPLRIIVFGAHPDDCDLRAGGTASLWAAKGYAVKFVALTNGDAGPPVAGRRRAREAPAAEAQEAGRRLGIAEYEVLDNHDGELEPTLAVRQQVIRRIRQWNADVVIAPRPNDYHPDHRYAGVLVQDSAYMVVVPNVTPDTPPLQKNPVFLYVAGPLPAAEPVPARRRRGDRLGDRTRRSARSTRTSPSSTSGCRGSTASSPKCRRTPPRGCLAQDTAQRPKLSDDDARRPAKVVRPQGRRRARRRRLRSLRVRPPPDRSRTCGPSSRSSHVGTRQQDAGPDGTPIRGSVPSVRSFCPFLLSVPLSVPSVRFFAPYPPVRFRYSLVVPAQNRPPPSPSAPPRLPAGSRPPPPPPPNTRSTRTSRPAIVPLQRRPPLAALNATRSSRHQILGRRPGHPAQRHRLLAGLAPWLNTNTSRSLPDSSSRTSSGSPATDTGRTTPAQSSTPALEAPRGVVGLGEVARRHVRPERQGAALAEARRPRPRQRRSRSARARARRACRLERLLVPAARQRLARVSARAGPRARRAPPSLCHGLHVGLARAGDLGQAEPGDHRSGVAALVVPAGARLEHERAAAPHVLAQLRRGARPAASTGRAGRPACRPPASARPRAAPRARSRAARSSGTGPGRRRAASRARCRRPPPAGRRTRSRAAGRRRSATAGCRRPPPARPPAAPAAAGPSAPRPRAPPRPPPAPAR